MAVPSPGPCTNSLGSPACPSPEPARNRTPGLRKIPPSRPPLCHGAGPNSSVAGCVLVPTFSEECCCVLSSGTFSGKFWTCFWTTRLNPAEGHVQPTARGALVPLCAPSVDLGQTRHGTATGRPRSGAGAVPRSRTQAAPECSPASMCRGPPSPRLPWRCGVLLLYLRPQSEGNCCVCSRRYPSPPGNDRAAESFSWCRLRLPVSEVGTETDPATHRPGLT